MKYLISSLLLAFMFSGCVTDNMYNVGKTIYLGGKTVVIQNYDLLDDSVKEKLENFDDYATRYDTAREIFKESTVGNDTEVVK